MTDLQAILEISAARHRHLCPRQVLGARMGVLATAVLGLSVPRRDKRLLIFTETDGCFADGLEAATGCAMGHRTLRLIDFGKIAATFVDVKTETAVRLAPRPTVRELAHHYAPAERKAYYAQLHGYQMMPDSELFTVQPVRLTVPLRHIISRAGVRVVCVACGEEVINERELVQADGRPLCQACAGRPYYTADSYPALLPTISPTDH